MAGGAIDMMNKSIANNKALLGKRKSLKELYNEIDTFSKTKTGIVLKKSSPEFMKALRIELKRKKKIQIIKSSLILLISILIVLYMAQKLF